MLGTGYTGTCNFRSEGEYMLHHIPKCLAEDILGPVASAMKGIICFLIFQNT
jgi:hypothetical protein